MALSLQLSLLFFLLLQAILIPTPINCGDYENNLLQGLNSYRQSQNRPPLFKNDRAECLADEIAGQLADRPCDRVADAITSSTSQTQLRNYQGLLGKCNIDINSTPDGVILPVCAPNLVPTLVLANYTTHFASYVHDFKYTGVGLGSARTWMVVVLTTNTRTGSFAGGATQPGNPVGGGGATQPGGPVGGGGATQPGTGSSAGSGATQPGNSVSGATQYRSSASATNLVPVAARWMRHCFIVLLLGVLVLVL